MCVGTWDGTWFCSSLFPPVLPPDAVHVGANDDGPPEEVLERPVPVPQAARFALTSSVR